MGSHGDEEDAEWIHRQEHQEKIAREACKGFFVYFVLFVVKPCSASSARQAVIRQTRHSITVV